MTDLDLDLVQLEARLKALIEAAQTPNCIVPDIYGGQILALLARVKAAEAERDTALTDSHDRIAQLSDDLQATESLHAGYVAANLKATDAAKAAGIAEGLERAAKIVDFTREVSRGDEKITAALRLASAAIRAEIK